jgi:hypothetical protein
MSRSGVRFPSPALTFAQLTGAERAFARGFACPVLQRPSNAESPDARRFEIEGESPLTTEKQVCDLFGSVLLHCGDGMAVCVKRKSDRRVTQALTNDLRMHPYL